MRIDATPILDIKPHMREFQPRSPRPPTGMGRRADGRVLGALTSASWARSASRSRTPRRLLPCRRDRTPVVSRAGPHGECPAWWPKSVRGPDRPATTPARRPAAAMRWPRRPSGRGRATRRRSKTSLTRPIRWAVSAVMRFVIAEQGHAQHLAERHVLQHLHRFVDSGHAVGDVGIEERRVVGREDDVGLGEHVERTGHTPCRSPHTRRASRDRRTSGRGRRPDRRT